MVAVEKDPTGEPRVWRVTRDEYEHLAELGAFHGKRVELVDGVILEMSPEGPPHSNTIDHLARLFFEALGRRARIRMQTSFVVSDRVQLEPDVAIVEEREYDRAHPGKAFLVIEVSDSSIIYDRGKKAALYASAGVEEYWVVNVRDQIVEVHTEIVAGRYARVTPYKRGGKLTPSAFPDVVIDVDQIF